MNPYYKDSKEFFFSASDLIDAGMSRSQILNSTLFFALGMERVLKGILYDINPIYVLNTPDFANSVQVLYKNRIGSNRYGAKDLPKNVDENVITFRISLLRAQLFSDVIFRNKNTLFALSEYRDIIAHHCLSKIDNKRCENLVKYGFYSIMSELSSELGIGKGRIFNGKQIKLAKIAENLATTAEERLNSRIQACKDRFDMLKMTPGYLDDKAKLTREVLLNDDKFETPCPACGNSALIYCASEYQVDSVMGFSQFVGFSVRRLECKYCKLIVEDPQELDILEIDKAVPSFVGHKGA